MLYNPHLYLYLYLYLYLRFYYLRPLNHLHTWITEKKKGRK